MTLDQFSQYLSWGLYILIFAITTVKAVRRPTRANIDVALFFLVFALIIGLSLARQFNLIPAGPVYTGINVFLYLSLAYMPLRLVYDFAVTPRRLIRSAEVVLVLLTIVSFTFYPPIRWVSMIYIAYIVGLLVYSIVAFLRQSRKANGVTMRRMRAVATGSIFLVLLFVLLVVNLFVPGIDWLSPITDFVQVASGVSYFIGFATPTVLRRAWQEPELRAFLGRAASLPRLSNTLEIIKEMERGAATSLGASAANLGIWDAERRVLQFMLGDKPYELTNLEQSLTGRAFLSQKPVFSDDPQHDNPANADTTRKFGIAAIVIAPITAGEKRLGVLTVTAPRAPIFAEEDISLVQLLADQAAVILESRALIDEATRIRAREEATRMKDDFLSAAAHDLKTPLTTLVMQSELLERRANRAPEAPADLESIRRMRREVHRLNSLVMELLDATRTEQGRLVGTLEEIDLVAYAQDVCERHDTERHKCHVEAHEQVTGMYDPNRILQLIENLVENAVKYSPGGGPVTVKIWSEGLPQVGGDEGKLNGHAAETWNHITVTDNGIGIPEADMPRVFERFHRGTNVNDRSFAGMGLGLFICKGIVEQHGGRIWVESPTTAGGSEQTSVRSGSVNNGTSGTSATTISKTTGGTTFHVVLPTAPQGLHSEPQEAKAEVAQAN